VAKDKPVHMVQNIVLGSTECGLTDKFGKFAISLMDAEGVTCKKCMKSFPYMVAKQKEKDAYAKARKNAKARKESA